LETGGFLIKKFRKYLFNCITSNFFTQNYGMDNLYLQNLEDKEILRPEIKVFEERNEEE
jgi:hypothetical protein